eukprot:SAG22_NODE_1259_length_4983_cov_2.399877_4_plen_307_part_00
MSLEAANISADAAPSSWVAASYYGIGEADRPLVLSLPFCTCWLLLVTAVPYLLTCAIFSHMDRRPGQYRRFKIKPDAPALTEAERREAWRASTVNVLFWDVIFGMGVAYPVWIWRGPPAAFSLLVELPALVLVYPLLTDIWFYFAHRLMHHRLLYARFHKMHHRFKHPEAICGLYCSPVEMMFVNACALMAGPVLMGSHPFTWGIWSAVSLNSVALSHSGYKYVSQFYCWHCATCCRLGNFSTYYCDQCPDMHDCRSMHDHLQIGAEGHDLHHQLFSVNYGVVMPHIWDRLSGNFFRELSKEPGKS